MNQTTITIKNVEQLIAIKNILSSDLVDNMFLSEVITLEEVDFVFDMPDFSFDKPVHIKKKQLEELTFSTYAEGELFSVDLTNLTINGFTNPIQLSYTENQPYKTQIAEQSAKNAFICFCEADIQPLVPHSDIEANSKNKNAMAYLACFGESVYPLEYGWRED